MMKPTVVYIVEGQGSNEEEREEIEQMRELGVNVKVRSGLFIEPEHGIEPADGYAGKLPEHYKTAKVPDAKKAIAAAKANWEARAKLNGEVAAPETPKLDKPGKATQPNKPNTGGWTANK